VFTAELSGVLEYSVQLALTKAHCYVTLEHVLIALLSDFKINEIFANCAVDVDKLSQDLTEFIDTLEKIDLEDEDLPERTPAVERVLNRAYFQVKNSGRDKVATPDVLIALFEESDSDAVFFLAKQGLTRIDVLDYVSHGVIKLSNKNNTNKGAKVVFRESYTDEDNAFSYSYPLGGEDGGQQSLLEKFTENLTQKAKDGMLDPIIGRGEELDKIIRILCRRSKNNPLIVGDPGVGKTSLGAALAVKLVSEKSVPRVLKDFSIYSLDTGALVAGTRYRGDLEERVRLLIGELEAQGRSILLIDEIHNLLGSGATSSGSLDLAALLKPVLGNGRLRCLGITTFEDYRRDFRKDQGFARRFSLVELKEPSRDEAIEILKGLRETFEKHHQVLFLDEALDSAVDLSAKYISERFLPDKAIDVIDEAGARNSLLEPQKRKDKLDISAIEEIVSLMIRAPIPSGKVTAGDSVRELKPRLASSLFGQNEAIESVVKVVKLNKAGLRSPNLPVGSFLFAGPTGVGKTELAKSLARELGVHFHRFDMSECMDKISVSRLIGAAPGYVGYEDGGQLVDKIRKHPHSVLLFDEIEKAHPDIFDLLLQVLDDATLSDSQGRKADFRHAVIILTTNAGSEKAKSLGFGSETQRSLREEAIKKLFKPEFRNRLDEIIYFNPLSKSEIHKVAKKFTHELSEQLAERNVKLKISDEALEYFSQQGFDPYLGARPMRRYIQNELSDRLADELLFGKLINGGTVFVNLVDNKINLSIKKNRSKN
jgi:ATP-dependent Clp protease ATP-binding subunit ClpA